MRMFQNIWKKKIRASEIVSFIGKTNSQYWFYYNIALLQLKSPFISIKLNSYIQFFKCQNLLETAS